MKSKSVDEVLKERCNDDYKKSASYLCKTLLSRNEELEKCVSGLVDVVEGYQQEQLNNGIKVECISVIVSNAKKLLNNE